MKKYILGVVVALVLGVGLILSHLYFNRLVNLPTGGMSNTILPDEKVFSSGLYLEINRGDIMVFKYPKDPKINYIKRIVGMPGETIQIRGQKVFINDKELPEKRVLCELNYHDAKAPLKEISTEGTGSYNTYHDKEKLNNNSLNPEMKFAVDKPFQIPAGEYFVMGDSRDNSLDSRYWGDSF